jgi:hypothetical protein
LLIGLWVVKTVMVKQFQEPQPDPLLIPLDQYAHVHHFLEPPPRAVVFQGFGTFAFPLPGLGTVAINGCVLSTVPAEAAIGDATASPPIWHGIVSKDKFHAATLGISGDEGSLDDLPSDAIDNGGEPMLKLWPLETNESQIRVRHPRPRNPRHRTPP